MRASWRLTAAGAGPRQAARSVLRRGGGARLGAGVPVRAGCGLAVLLGAVLIGGCGDSQGSGVSRLTPRGVPFLEGVPVPEGFALVEDMVMDHESGGRRMARHEYRGSADPHAVRNFYREQMPLMGWDRVSDQNLKGLITIRFEKQQEACTVEIQTGGGRLGTGTTVRILVVPFNRTPLEPPKQPVP